MMEDEDDDILMQQQQLHHANMVPEKDVNGFRGGGVENIMGDGAAGGDIMFGGTASASNNLATQAEAAFNQQRVVVGRLSRAELEDR